MPLVISCLSQKGGVGKSTLARLIATTYAQSGWNVLIADFNTTQLTSVKWAKLRAEANILPPVRAEAWIQPTKLRRSIADLVVADGRPDSDQTSLDIARLSDLVIVPTGLSLDDLEPQVTFALELQAKGVPNQRIMFVLNKVTESESSIEAARKFINQHFEIAGEDLSARTAYAHAQNQGRALNEVGSKVGQLEAKANMLMVSVVDAIANLEEL